MSKVKPVILCGGSGERLWPLSRKSYPKQFLNLIGTGSLFQQAARRFDCKESPIVITGDDYRFIVRQQLGEIGIDEAEVIIEPESKNTGPAILAAAYHIASKEPNSIMLVMPSDHYIPDAQAFTEMVEEGASQLDKKQIICFGVKPERPETGYGYIRVGHRDAAVKPVLAFTEKPSYERAQGFIRDSCYLWNAGIFMMRARELLDVAAELQPQMLKIVIRAVRGSIEDLDFLRLDLKEWAKMPAKSFDYAFMEKAKLIGCITFKGSWSDLGNWPAVARLHDADESGNVLDGSAYQIESKNCLLWSAKEGQVLTGIGLENIIAISMGDAVLVADRTRSQEIKSVVAALRKKGVNQATQQEEEYRPWGSFLTIAKDKGFHVKILYISARQRLSLQSHKYRSEHWVVVKGVATVVNGEQEFKLRANESTYIHAGDRHQLRNDSDEKLEIIEVQTGSYFGEDDIMRYEDLYKRS